MAGGDRPAAARRLDDGGKRFQPVPFALLPIVGHLELATSAGARKILRAPEEMRFCRVAATSGAARFLIISLDRLGDASLGDEAYVRLVDPHAADAGGDDHHILRTDEASPVSRPNSGDENGSTSRRDKG